MLLAEHKVFVRVFPYSPAPLLMAVLVSKVGEETDEDGNITEETRPEQVPSATGVREPHPEQKMMDHLARSGYKRVEWVYATTMPLVTASPPTVMVSLSLMSTTTQLW